MAALPEGGNKTGGGSGGTSGDSDSGIAKFSVSAEELKDVLECPVCLKVPRQPPIYQVKTAVYSHASIPITLNSFRTLKIKYYIKMLDT